MSIKHIIRKENNSVSEILPSDSSSKFLSKIKNTRFTTIEEKSASSKFTEYEILCQMRLSAPTLLEKETVIKWSVWRRFSEFKRLDQACKILL